MKEKKINKKVLGACLAGLAIVPCMGLFVACGNDPVVEPEPKSEIKIYSPFDTEYYLGEELDVTGGVLSYTDENGKTIQVAITENMISGFSTASTGTRSMIITYEGETVLVSYTVTDPFAFSLLDRTKDYESKKIREACDFGTREYSAKLYFAANGVDMLFINLTTWEKDFEGYDIRTPWLTGFSMNYTKSFDNNLNIWVMHCTGEGAYTLKDGESITVTFDPLNPSSCKVIMKTIEATHGLEEVFICDAL